ncbi:unnamed protein product, partial [Closterium sp. NIES-54]
EKEQGAGRPAVTVAATGQAGDTIREDEGQQKTGHQERDEVGDQSTVTAAQCLQLLQLQGQQLQLLQLQRLPRQCLQHQHQHLQLLQLQQPQAS